MDISVIAHHEAGHAVVGHYFEQPIEVVTIIRDAKAGTAGFVLTDRSGHNDLMYEDELQSQVIFERSAMVAMAG